MRRGPFVLAALALTAGCAAPDGAPTCEGTFEATVTRIVDGDTLDVDPCGRVRLALIDTPERGEPGFEEASTFAARRCPVGGPVTVDLDAGQPLDTTGTRLVGVLYCGGDNLNAELLAAGLAVFLPQFCDRSEFAGEPWAAEGCRAG